MGSFHLTGGLEGFIGPVMKQRVGQRPADALVEQEEHECRLDPFIGEPVTAGSAHTFEQALGFQCAKVVAELGKRAGAGGEAEGGKDRVMDIGGLPPVELRAAVQQDLSGPPSAASSGCRES